MTRDSNLVVKKSQPHMWNTFEISLVARAKGRSFCIEYSIPIARENEKEIKTSSELINFVEIWAEAFDCCINMAHPVLNSV